MKIYMIGIGGIGMSALAQLYIHEGHTVSGSDRGHSPTTDLLENLGVHVLYEQGADNVPADADLVVYSDAIAVDHPERVQASKYGTPQMSYFKALGVVSKNKRTIAVAGTHGKTTTTGMLAKILIDAGISPTVIVGSLTKDFGSNYVAGTSDWFVVEACEYRDHLLELTPEILVITNIEWDHTDWFKTEEQMRTTFQKARDRVPSQGVVIDAAMYSTEPDFEIGLIGEFNKDNARAAAAATRAAVPTISEDSIRASLKNFQGTWRRFEHKGTSKNGALVYDDYAHHPTAIRETITGVRQKFPDKHVVVAFHPHLYSRTHDLFDGFVAALATADSVVLAPIYAAREPDTGVVSSDLIADAIAKLNPQVTSLPDFDAIFSSLMHHTSDTIIVTMGAGDIYKVADMLVAD